MNQQIQISYDLTLSCHFLIHVPKYDNEEPGKDLNVLAAWIQGYTGKGVVVTVVDDGESRRNSL